MSPTNSPLQSVVGRPALKTDRADLAIFPGLTSGTLCFAQLLLHHAGIETPPKGKQKEGGPKLHQ